VPAEVQRRGRRGGDAIYFDHRGQCRDPEHHRHCPGRWRGAVSRIEDGKRVRRKVSGRTKSEIKDRLKALHEELDQGVKPSASYKVADALTDWLEHGLDGRSPKTLSTYRQVTAPLLPLIGTIPLRELTAADVRAALTRIGATRSSRTVKIAHQVLTQAIRHAEANDLVRRNVAALIRAPKGGAKGRPSARRGHSAAGRTTHHDHRRNRVSTHTRIRPFNTRDTYPEQNLDNDLCQAVIASDTIYLRGQIGQNLETSENVGVGDVTAQAEQAMTNIDLLLREAGSSLQDIVKVTVYLVDPRYREPVYRVMGRWLKGVYPVSTGLVISALARPEWLVEIDATAVCSAAS
jgi:enamine deaminase RidA (YjgF/YER057c/UK114 family)